VTNYAIKSDIKIKFHHNSLLEVIFKTYEILQMYENQKIKKIKMTARIFKILLFKIFISIISFFDFLILGTF
jgi:hypothetical protein